MQLCSAEEQPEISVKAWKRHFTMTVVTVGHYENIIGLQYVKLEAVYLLLCCVVYWACAWGRGNRCLLIVVVVIYLFI